MSTLSVRCPHCQAVLKVGDALAGQATTCGQCGQRLLVPTTAPPPVVSAPPVVSQGLGAAPAPSIRVTRNATTKTAAKAASDERTSNKKEPRRKSLLHLVMLVGGVTVLAITMLVLLWLTDNQAGRP